MFSLLYQIGTLLLFLFALTRLFGFFIGSTEKNLHNIGITVAAIIVVGVLQVCEPRVLAFVQPQAPKADVTQLPEATREPESTQFPESTP